MSFTPNNLLRLVDCVRSTGKPDASAVYGAECGADRWALIRSVRAKTSRRAKFPSKTLPLVAL